MLNSLIITGAGIGGVSTAAHLAKAGLEVVVLEKVRCRVVLGGAIANVRFEI